MRPKSSPAGCFVSGRSSISRPSRGRPEGRPLHQRRVRSSDRPDIRGTRMKRLLIVIVALSGTAVLAQNRPWNNPGNELPATTAPGGPAPTRDISGVWDAGAGGIGARGQQAAPLTAGGEVISKTHHS